MWHTYFYQPSWCVMLIPNNIKEMREEKDLPSGYPKRNKANFRSILHKNMKMIKILFGISLSMFLNALSNEQPNTNTHCQFHLCLLITDASFHTQPAMALTSEVPVANKWWTGLMSHTLFSLVEKSREKRASWTSAESLSVYVRLHRRPQRYNKFDIFNYLLWVFEYHCT